jgi:hypothetical protein
LIKDLPKPQLAKAGSWFKIWIPRVLCVYPWDLLRL